MINFEEQYGNIISKYVEGMNGGAKSASSGTESLTEGGKIGLGFMVGCAMIAHAIVSIADESEEQLWGESGSKKPIGENEPPRGEDEEDLDNINRLLADSDPWDKDSDGNDLHPESPTSWPPPPGNGIGPF